MQTPFCVDVKDENPVWLDTTKISKYRSHVARCLFLSQDRADISFAVNELCQRSFTTQLFQIEATRSVLEGRGNGFKLSNSGT